MSIDKYNILVKTMLGYEKIVANRVKEIDPEAEVLPSPLKFKGLVLIRSGRYNRDELVDLILKNVIEADKVYPIHFVSKADPKEICSVLEKEIDKYISSSESFAVRTTRRGKHEFTSIDVNVIVGDCIRRKTNASVNLRYPDKVVYVEIIQDTAFISILPGSVEYHKYGPGKKDVSKIFKRIAIIQMPFLGPLESIREMGKRIGREVQNFEVRELVITPVGLVNARELAEFINSVLDGIESRYRIQLKSYHRKPWKVPVYIMDLHQLIRDRGDEYIIVFEPEGRYITEVRDELIKIILHSNKRVNLLFGSRQGIPVGVYRYADLIIDIAPGITLSTDYAAAAGLIALLTTIYNAYTGGEHEGNNPGSR